MDGAFELFTDDAVRWLGGIPAGIARLVVLDPGVPGRAPRAARKDRPAVPAFPEQRLPALLYEVHRVLAPKGLCWWICEGAHAFKAARLSERLGFALGAPLVWDRGDGPGARLAFVLPLTHRTARSPGPELVQSPRPDDAPTALPRVLCEALVEAGSEPGDVVVDPFMGQGAMGIAALTLGRSYLGNDLVPLADLVAERLVKLGGVRAEPLVERGGGTPEGGDRPMRAALGMGPSAQLTIFGDGAELR